MDFPIFEKIVPYSTEGWGITIFALYGPATQIYFLRITSWDVSTIAILKLESFVIKKNKILQNADIAEAFATSPSSLCWKAKLN